jgi:hypothetical protein
MKRLISWWSALFARNSFLWTVTTFAVVYLVFTMAQGDIWLRMWLKGDAYRIYQTTFILSFVALYSLILTKQRNGGQGFLACALIGVFVGYLCGLLGYFAITILMPEGADRIFRTLERSTGTDLLLILVVPAILLNWAIGLVVGALTAIARRARHRVATPAST